ncbi:MAG: transposase [Desulfobacterales bacterium]|jgi:REP element-mobilizing transposase RayT|nr:transposase [Desulfobacterales bacterium]
MSRPLRIEYPGAWYHVMNRGRRAEKIFFDQEDYAMFIELLKEASSAWNIRICAYCLMPNHYHLLIQTPEGNISRSMRHINGIYTQRYNRRHGCDGQLLRGRYKSILVSEDSYLLQLVRYIHRNPVEAGIEANPYDYSWSSHRGYLSASPKWDWLYKEVILSMLCKDESERVKRYRAFVGTDADEKVSNIIKGKKWPAVLGDQKFTEWVKERFYGSKFHREIAQARELAPEADKIINVVCNFYSVLTEDIYKVKRGEFNEPRNVSIFLMRKLRREPLKKIGDRFQMVKDSSVSSVIERLKNKMRTDRKLKERVEKLHCVIRKSQEEI